MKRTVLVGAAVFLALVAFGCGGGDDHHNPPVVSLDVFSSGGTSNDGDIEFDPVRVTYTPRTTAVFDNILVGTFPNDINSSFNNDSRGYLTFSLAEIPPGAAIEDARLFLMINDVVVTSGSSVVVTPSMVSFGALDTLGSSAIQNLFNNAEILTSTVSYDIFPGDIGFDSPPDGMDVTGALIEARTLGFSELQIKLTGQNGYFIFDDFALPAVIHVHYVN